MKNHCFDIEVAEKLGVNAAIVLANFAHLQANRKAQGGEKYYMDGRWWVHHTYESLAKFHTYFSVQQIRRIMRLLLDSGALVQCNPNKWKRDSYWSVAPEFTHVSKSTDQSVGIDSSEVSKSTVVLHNNLHITKGRFKPPSIEDVTEYCKERGNNVNAQNFIDHYEANGWMRGKSKIKCWKACVRTWEKNSKTVSVEGAYV